MENETPRDELLRWARDLRAGGASVEATVKRAREMLKGGAGREARARFARREAEAERAQRTAGRHAEDTGPGWTAMTRTVMRRGLRAAEKLLAERDAEVEAVRADQSRRPDWIARSVDAIGARYAEKVEATLTAAQLEAQLWADRRRVYLAAQLAQPAAMPSETADLLRATRLSNRLAIARRDPEHVVELLGRLAAAAAPEAADLAELIADSGYPDELIQTAALHVRQAEEPRAERALVENPDRLDAAVELVLLDDASTRLGIVCDLAAHGVLDHAARALDQLVSGEGLDFGVTGSPSGDTRP